MPGGIDADLIALPVITPRAPASPTEPERHETYAIDRSSTVDIVAAGMGGSVALALAAFGIWRLAAANSKDCPYCGARMSRGARSCRHCFRAVPGSAASFASAPRPAPDSPAPPQR